MSHYQTQMLAGQSWKRKDSDTTALGYSKQNQNESSEDSNSTFNHAKTLIPSGVGMGNLSSYSSVRKKGISKCERRYKEHLARQNRSRKDDAQIQVLLQEFNKTTEWSKD